MGTSGLPDIYTRGLRVYISGEPRYNCYMPLCTNCAWASAKQLKPIIIIIIIITSNDDIQPSTVVSKQLPSGLVLVILIIHGPVNFLNTQL